MPAGKTPFRVYPIGAVMAGDPDRGEKVWPLSPSGEFRSPISRGGLLQVGYTNASSFSASMVFVTAAPNAPRYLISSRHAALSGPCGDVAWADSSLTCTDG